MRGRGDAGRRLLGPARPRRPRPIPPPAPPLTAARIAPRRAPRGSEAAPLLPGVGGAAAAREGAWPSGCSAPLPHSQKNASAAARRPKEGEPKPRPHRARRPIAWHSGSNPPANTTRANAIGAGSCPSPPPCGTLRAARPEPGGKQPRAVEALGNHGEARAGIKSRRTETRAALRPRAAGSGAPAWSGPARGAAY